MSNTNEITASPRLRVMFAAAAAIMFSLWAWSLVPPIENWGNPNEDGFSYVGVFYATIICLPVGLYLLVGAIAAHGQYVRRARNAFFIAAGITILVVAFLIFQHIAPTAMAEKFLGFKSDCDLIARTFWADIADVRLPTSRRGSSFQAEPHPSDRRNL